MVDLPTVSRELATTQAPSPGVSAGDLVAPYARLGNAFDKLGGALEDVGVDMAKEAGKRAVTTDDQGNISVQTLPPIGKAAEAFNRSAQMTYLTQLEPNIKEKVLAKRLELDGNPGAFHDWAASYTSELADGQPSDELRNSVKQLAERHTSSTYQGMAIARHTQDVTNNRTALTNSLDSLANEAAQLAWNGGTDSDDYKGRIADYVVRQQQAMTDPSLGYTKEKAAADLADLTNRHSALATVGMVRRIAEDKTTDENGVPNGGVTKAKALADSILSDEAFAQLSAEQRLQFNKLAIGQIRQLTTEGQVAIGALNQEAGLLVDRVQKGLVAPAEISDFKGRAADAGATKALAKIIQADALSKTYPWLASLPSEDRANFINGQNGRPDSRGILDKFENAESGGNINAKSATSSALGPLQWTKGSWLQLIRQSRPDLAEGKTDDELLALRTDRGLSRDMAEVNNRQNAATFAGQGIFPSEGRLYLAHVLGPRDAIAVSSADPNTPMKGLIWDKAYLANPELMAKYPTAGAFQDWANRKMGQAPTTPQEVKSLSPSNQAAFFQMAIDKAGEDLTAHAGTIKKAVDAGFVPNPRDMDELGALAHAVGTDEQKQQAINLGALAEFGGRYVHADPVTRASLRTEIADRYRMGGSQVLGQFLTYADQIDQKVTQAYQTAPYDASSRYGDRPPVPAVDPNNPDGLSDALQQRVTRQAIFRNEQALPPTSALDPTEANAWKTALAHGDLNTAGAFFREVANLPKDIQSATFNSKPIVDGITGMVNSRDPDRMELGFTAIDKIWRDNPVVAASAFGSDAIDRMQTWQAKRTAFSPQEIAKDFLTVDDPAQKAARDRFKADAEKELATTTPKSVASMFSRGLLASLPLVGGNATLPDGSIPQTAMAPERMLSDYRTTYTTLRTSGISAEKAAEGAAERLKQTYGPSEAAGNVIMARPPELVINPRNGQQFYPSLGGSSQWIKDEINSKIEAMLGPRVKQDGDTFVGDAKIDQGGNSPNWKFGGLVSDQKTEEDIANGRPPSYAIVAIKPNGVIETIIDLKTGATRHSFNIAPYAAKYLGEMQGAERFVKGRTANFGIGQGYTVGSEL